CPTTVLKVWKIVVPGLVFPPLKAMCWAPCTGPTPSTGPFCNPTGPPVPPTVQPVMFVEPTDKTCPAPAASAGDSKLPLLNGAPYDSKAAVNRDNPNRKENLQTRTFFIYSLQRPTFSPSAS